MASEQDYSIDVDYGPRDKYGVSLARYKEISADADDEAARQKEASKPLAGVREPDVFDRAMEKKRDVFDRAMEARKAKKATSEPVPSELNAMRRRLGMKETADTGESFPRKLYNFMGQRTGIGATAGGILGTALGPSTGGLSILIPALAAGAGGAMGAATEGKNPIKEGAFEGGMQGLFGGAARVAKPVKQFVEGSIVKTFGGRAGVSEAAEGVMKRWFTPQVTAESLYKKAAATGVHVPLGETANTIDTLLKAEINRMPLESQIELKKVLRPILRFVRPTIGAGKKKTQFLTAQPVADTLADLRRLSSEAKKAFGGKTPNADLGNAINKIRAAMFDDLERVGVPEAREASKNYRRQMAIEDLSEQLARPIPGVKLREAYRNNKLFDKSFTPAEKAQIDRIVKKLEFVAPSGGAGIIGKIATTAAGGVAGGLTGIPYAHELGGLAGYVGAEKLRELLASPAGRNFMERVLEDSYKLGTGKVVQTIGPVLSIFARGLIGQREETEQ